MPRSSGLTPQRCQVRVRLGLAAALAASAAALAAGFLGSRHGTLGTPGAGGDAPPRAAYGMDIVGSTVHVPLGCPGANLPPHPEAVYTAIAQVGALGGAQRP